MYFDVHTHTPNNDQKETVSILNIHKNFQSIPSGRFVSLGIHPWYLDQSIEEQLAILKSLAHLPQVWAIGECGIDNNLTIDHTHQANVFQAQIDVAKTVSKPLIIHCVRAFQEVLNLLNGNTTPVIFHGINNKATVIKPIISEGHFLSFGKSLLKPSPRIIESLNITPLNKLLLETDDSVATIKEIYSQAAEILNIEEKRLVLQIEDNFRSIFPQVCKI